VAEPVPSAETPNAPVTPGRLVAVIDIGATAIRMEIAEITNQGVKRTLDSLSRSVPLGKDTFTTGSIQPSTTEDCVQILRQFSQILKEYGITDPASINAVATSAVREAVNRDKFIDRLYMATRIPVVCINELELSRLTYMGVRNLLAGEPLGAKGDALVIEVGGGSTELLLIQNGQVAFSETYRLGSLRLREMLTAFQTPPQRARSLLAETIQRTILQMRQTLPVRTVPVLIAISGDARFAADQLSKDWKTVKFGRLATRTFSRFADKILAESVDALVARYGLSYPDAETLGPALLAYRLFAQAFEVEELIVPKITLRTALELEMSTQEAWAGDFDRQIEHAAVALGEKYRFDRRHSQHVADLCGQLFDLLQEDHRLGPRQRFLLRIAALLHEIGQTVNRRGHHKHAMYLIMNSDLFGLTRQDILLVALIARYHRRAAPLPMHPYYNTLDREARLQVQALAAILRVADALERSHNQRVQTILGRREGGRLILTVPDVDELTLERLALKEKGKMFEEVYGMPIALRTGPALLGPESNV
jgi:exopolyphosphatase/guanosine-5'-triphosphate,3'-diphosphate pyrophosphatase